MSSDSAVRLGAQERRAQLLSTSRTVFGEHGFTATSMNDIADAAGVTKPVLYQHFASKHDLFHELLTETAELLVSRLLSEVEAAETGREKVERGVHGYVAFFAENPHRFRVLYGEGVRSDPVFSKELRNVDNSFHQLSAARIDIADLDQSRRLVAAQALSGMLEHAVERWIHSDSTLTSDELADTLASLAWRGLRVSPVNG